MRCPDCKVVAGEGDCGECRALAEELRANSEALNALRDEELPPLVVGIPRRGLAYSWIVAAAAAVLIAVALPILRQAAVAPQHSAMKPSVDEPLKIKMLTPDPDVVIYWLIDSREGELP